jgi:hypothetical protein
VAAHQGQTVGRHERRPHLVEVNGGHATPSRRATRAGQAGGTRASRGSRHAAPAGWATFLERAGRFATQARAWWTEGADRAAARARESGTGVRSGPGAGARTGGRNTTIRSVDTRSRAAAGAQRTRSAGPAPRHLAEAQAGRRVAWHEDLVTGWCALLLVLGLYLEGWGRGNPVGDGSGTVLTPWSGVLAVGLVATAGWILTRGQRRGAWSPRAVPAGYRVALATLALAMVAVAGDAMWHGLSGPELGLARLVGPFHLMLFAGACLVVTSTLRAAWSGPSPARVPGLRGFWPVVLPATLLVATTAWFFQGVAPVAAGLPGSGAIQVAGAAQAAGTTPMGGLLGLLAHNLLFVAPVLLLLLRWQTPLGTFTVMAGSVALLLATQTGLGLVGLAGAAVLGGAAADVAVHLLRPSPQRRWAARAVAVIASAVYWTSHFALLRAGYGAGPELELWLGSVVWACLSGLALAVAMWPPAVPLTAWNRGRPAAARPAAQPAPMPTSMPARMVGR